MYNVNNLFNNDNIEVTDEKGCFKVIRHLADKSAKGDATSLYFQREMEVCKQQVLFELNGNTVVVQAGAMQWMLGNVNMVTGVKGVGDLVGKMFSAKVTKESAIKPEYTGQGIVMLEPSYKHHFLIDVSEWGSIVLEDGLFLACDRSLEIKTVMRQSISSAALGGEGLFNLCLIGKGIAAIESPVPMAELYEIELENDCIKIDGSMAIAWSSSLQFTVEKAGASVIGSAASGEGLVNVYRGTGKILMCPV